MCGGAVKFCSWLWGQRKIFELPNSSQNDSFCSTKSERNRVAACAEQVFVHGTESDTDIG